MEECIVSGEYVLFGGLVASLKLFNFKDYSLVMERDDENDIFCMIKLSEDIVMLG